MAVEGGKDRLGDLADDLLRHVLSRLRPDDALRTCVLDTRWRELWRRTTSLHLNAYHCQRLQQLAKLFIQLRGNSPLAKCEISTCPDDFPDHHDSYDYPDHVDSLDTHTKLLIKYALQCHVQELLLRANDYEDDPIALDMPLISHQLNILHLERATCSALNFSGCPVLEELRMETCSIYARKISSKSLKRLCIINLCLLPEDFHIRIFAPDLISLQIDDFVGATPFLEDMSFLVTANIGLGVLCHDYCEQNLRDCDDHSCSCHVYPVEGGLLLNGLCNAVNLELIAEPIMNLIGATAAPETMEQAFVCHLEVVKIVCRKVDVGIRKISSILSTFGVDYKKISIDEKSFCSNYSNFS